MQENELNLLRYPIGKYVIPSPITDEKLNEWISILEELPQKFLELTSSMNDEQLDTPYRPDGWTVRQVVHHVSDSHHHSYIRFKWGLTEDNPVIKPYFEQEWANLFDTRTAPIQMSLDHLKAVHFKLVYLLRGLSDEQLNRTFTHPDGNEITTLKENVGRYVWHGSHHHAHIANLAKREGW